MLESKLNLAGEEILVIYLLAVNRLARAVADLNSGVYIADRVAAIRRLNDLRASCQVLHRLAFPEAEQID